MLLPVLDGNQFECQNLCQVKRVFACDMVEQKEDAELMRALAATFDFYPWSFQY